MAATLNSSTRIRELIVSPQMHDMMTKMDGKLDRLTEASITRLWNAGIERKALYSYFVEKKPKLVIPVYFREAPQGFQFDPEVGDVLKTLVHDGHVFVDEIFGITNEPFDPGSFNDKELYVCLLEWSNPVMKLRFRNEGDMVVVAGFKAEYDQRMAEFDAENGKMQAGSTSGFMQSSNASAARTSLGLGSGVMQNARRPYKSLINSGVQLGVSSRGMQKKTP